MLGHNLGEQKIGLELVCFFTDINVLFNLIATLVLFI